MTKKIENSQHNAFSQKLLKNGRANLLWQTRSMHVQALYFPLPMEICSIIPQQHIYASHFQHQICLGGHHHKMEGYL